MDKETLSNYGWITICVLVLAVMIALATPFGKFVQTGFEATYEGFDNTSNKAFSVLGLSENDGGTGENGGSTALTVSIYETQSSLNTEQNGCADDHIMYATKGMENCMTCGQTLIIRQDVAVATFEITDGQTWRQLIESGKYAELTLNTQLDADFNNVTFAAYNGEAIVLNNVAVSLDSAIDTNAIYKLGSISGPIALSNNRFWTIPDTSIGGTEFAALQYDFNSTSETEGTYTIYNITITDNVLGDGMSDGCVVGSVVSTGTYTSAHGLYIGQYITLDDGSKVALGDDWALGIQATDGTRTIILGSFDAYDYMPADPNDVTYDYVWDVLN